MDDPNDGRTEYLSLSPQSTEARSDRSKLISESMILLERALPKMLREREGSRNNNGERGRAPTNSTLCFIGTELFWAEQDEG